MRPHLNGKKLGMVANVYHPTYSRKYKIGESWSSPTWAKSEILFQKKQEQNGLRHVLSDRAAASSVKP
jgi:hypothetical protein